MSQITILVSLAVVFSNGCKDGPVDVHEKQPAFYAKVVDSNNNSIAEVGIHYIFYVGTDVVSRNLLLQYVLQSPDSVTLKISDSFGNVVATPLNKQYQPAGTHAYNYNASTITNGVYSCSVTGASINQEMKLFVRTDDVSQLKITNPFTKTDASGNIQISYSTFGIGEHFTYQTGGTQLQLTIADSIQVILVKQGYKDFAQNIKLDTTKAFETTFQLQSN
jgi:hypothetical protein